MRAHARTHTRTHRFGSALAPAVTELCRNLGSLWWFGVYRFVSYDIRETDGEWAEGVYRSVPTKLLDRRDGPVQFVRMGKHRQLCLSVVGEDCEPCGCAGVFMGSARLAASYPVDIAERRALWSETMSGELAELHILNVSKGFNVREISVIADWPEYENYALPVTAADELLLVPFSIYLSFDVSNDVFQVKALLAVKVFSSQKLKTDGSVKRMWATATLLENILPQAFYKISAQRRSEAPLGVQVAMVSDPDSDADD